MCVPTLTPGLYSGVFVSREAESYGSPGVDGGIILLVGGLSSAKNKNPFCRAITQFCTAIVYGCPQPNLGR